MDKSLDRQNISVPFAWTIIAFLAAMIGTCAVAAYQTGRIVQQADTTSEVVASLANEFAKDRAETNAERQALRLSISQLNASIIQISSNLDGLSSKNDARISEFGRRIESLEKWRETEK